MTKALEFAKDLDNLGQLAQVLRNASAAVQAIKDKGTQFDTELMIAANYLQKEKKNHKAANALYDSAQDVHLLNLDYVASLLGFAADHLNPVGAAHKKIEAYMMDEGHNYGYGGDANDNYITSMDQLTAMDAEDEIEIEGMDEMAMVNDLTAPMAHDHEDMTDYYDIEVDSDSDMQHPNLREDVMLDDDDEVEIDVADCQRHLSQTTPEAERQMGIHRNDVYRDTRQPMMASGADPDREVFVEIDDDSILRNASSNGSSQKGNKTHVVV